MVHFRKFFPTFAALVITASMMMLSGCERKATIVDIETPGRNVKVERSVDTGAVEIQVTDND